MVGPDEWHKVTVIRDLSARALMQLQASGKRQTSRPVEPTMLNRHCSAIDL